MSKRTKPGVTPRLRDLAWARIVVQQSAARAKVGGWTPVLASPEELLLTWHVANGICRVCRRPGKLHADHDHKTGTFRGWICQHCNQALGSAFDSVETLHALADYLVVSGTALIEYP